jgi:hypothetical protein
VAVCGAGTEWDRDDRIAQQWRGGSGAIEPGIGFGIFWRDGPLVALVTDDTTAALVARLDSGAQLNLDFINGFAPTTGDTFDILSDNNLTPADSFSQVNVRGLEPGWEFAIEQQNGNEVIRSLNNGVAVPEPSTAAMVIFLFAAMTILHQFAGGRRAVRR